MGSPGTPQSNKGQTHSWSDVTASSSFSYQDNVGTNTRSGTSNNTPRGRNSDRNSKDEQRGRINDANKNRSWRNEHANKREMETPKHMSIMNKEDVTAGLSFQRLCNEKPDIDNLANSLMQLYHNLETRSTEAEGNQEQLDRIILAALRVKSRVESHITNASGRVKSILLLLTNASLKERTIKMNVPKIERKFIGMCRKGLINRSINELYGRLSRVLAKIPPTPQLDEKAAKLEAQKSSILEIIGEKRKQLETQKAQLESICKIMMQGDNT